jgi:hypothetical protein
MMHTLPYNFDEEEEEEEEWSSRWRWSCRGYLRMVMFSFISFNMCLLCFPLFLCHVVCYSFELCTCERLNYLSVLFIVQKSTYLIVAQITSTPNKFTTQSKKVLQVYETFRTQIHPSITTSGNNIW